MSSQNGVAGHVEGATWIGAGQSRSLFAILPRRGRRDRLVRHQVHGCGVEFVEVLPDQQMQLIAYLVKTNHGNTRELAIQSKSIVDRRRDVTYAHWGT